MNAAMAAASPVSTIVAADRLGAVWGGVPNTAGIVGTGIGAIALTRTTNRWGWRAGLAFGYAAATVGGALAIAAVARSDITILSIGMLLLGLGNAGALLSRYAAAELYPVQRRGFAIGTLVWAGAVGAVGGPLLLAPVSVTASHLGWVALSGPFLFSSLASSVATAAVFCLPAGGAEPVQARGRLRDLVRTSPARSALAVMATAQVVMVAVMTAAPLDMHLHHHEVGRIGMALSAHTLGMFALSPLTGRLLDGLGARPVMLAGLLTLAIATASAVTAPHSQPVLQTAALFLLGYGWNLCFIGGSGRLASGLPAADRAQVEGAVDAAVWAAAATASLASTAVLSTGGYPLLAGLAGSLVVLPAVTLLNRK
ncbi:Major Facilitator Superfamily protein [Micromonospora rhizosphaerae]|uniref:Major Facilitator Superfamily protein n=2 Tax=Micromonospora rhizosphaerae TaxID=568872 RepID=A0A1C6RSL7_9ACTN|nr:Major Facilitator Superfamily protein [Micromonospora rhizosphaerae]